MAPLILRIAHVTPPLPKVLLDCPFNVIQQSLLCLSIPEEDGLGKEFIKVQLYVPQVLIKHNCNFIGNKTPKWIDVKSNNSIRDMRKVLRELELFAVCAEVCSEKTR